MYALSCVEKYVADNAGRLSDSTAEVLERARNCSGAAGAIPCSLIQSILGDALLADEFDRLVTSDPEYLQLVAEATRALAKQPKHP